MGRFNTIVGTGGIGTGTLWYLADDRTLGRDESRPGVLSDARDYCKQHIILHYLAQVLLDEVRVHAIGKVGGDPSGTRLLDEMRIAGIDTTCVEIGKDSVTMQSVCLQYPDYSVCNVTTVNSVSQHVDASYVHQCLERLAPHWHQKPLVLAVPEVPLEARIALLQAGWEQGAFCVASALREEAAAFLESKGLSLCHLLVINHDEAEAIFGFSGTDTEQLVNAVRQKIPKTNETLAVIITLGKDGYLAVDKYKTARKMVRTAKVVSTAGAGDAFTAGVICGLHFGYGLFSEEGHRTALDFGSFFAGHSVACKHTIDPGITRDIVLDFKTS